MSEAAEMDVDAEVMKSADEEFRAMQSEMPTVPKSRPGFNFVYAPYETVMKYALPVMLRHGFHITHALKRFDWGFGVETDLVFSRTGKVYATSVYPIAEGRVGKDQDLGKSLTYGKRYGTVLLLGLSIEGEPDADDAGVPQVKQTDVNF